MVASTSFPNNHPVRILIVDDEPYVLDATREYLEVSTVFVVDTAGTGTDALSMVQKETYDAIISDYDMEGMNGVELLRSIRNNGFDTPFILFTGKGREEVVISAFDNGANGYVMKGGEIKSQFADLVHKVTTIIDKKRAEDALREIEDRFKDIYINSPIAIEHYDKNGLLVDINPACSDLFGVRSIADVQDFNLFTDLNMPDTSYENLKNGETIRYQTEFDFERVRTLGIYQTTRTGVMYLDIQITPIFVGSHELSGYLVYTVDVSELLHMQEDLAEQKRFLDLLLETIPSPVFYKDRKGIYTGCNSAFEHFIGLPKEKIIGKSLHTIAPGTLSEVFQVKDKELLSKKGLHEYESQVTYRDGSLHDVIFQKATLLDKNGKVVGIIGIMHDITEKMKIQHALEESEAYIRTVLDNLPIGVAVNSVTPEVRFDYYNDQFLACYRVKPEHLKEPDGFWSAVYEDPIFREEIKNRIAGDVASGDPLRMHWENIPITRKGEESSYINAMNIPIPNRNLVISTVWDVTDKKRAEDRLRETNTLLEGMLNGIPDIIGIQYPDHTMIRYNQAGYDILGLTPDEVVGKPCYSFIGRSISCDTCATTSALQTKKIVAIEKYIPELKRYFLCRSNPILDDFGGVRLIVEQLTDITSRKQMEEAINQSNQKLRLLTGLTRHDILNLLNAIYFYHELALRTNEPDKVYEYIKQADEAGNRIEATIGFTREYEEFGIASSGWQEVYRIIDSAKWEIDIGPVIMENLVSPTLEVYADPIIRKVFTTLLENSIRHGKKVTMIRFSTLEEDENMKIVYEDDGVGIRVEEKVKIFGKGYGNHTGIGLFLTREILSITGLSIRECGVPGEGARFEILVPVGKWRK